jgi:HlyD family type I secretion membrane fusion protein
MSMSVALPRPPSRIRGTAIAGLALLVVSFGGLGLWSSLAPLSSAVLARGTLAVDSHRKTIQHLEGGIIESVLVREGDLVEDGQLLVRLDPTRDQASLQILERRLNEELARSARLRAEIAGLDAVRYPDDLLARTDEQPEIAAILAGQDEIFRARLEAVAGERSILENRITQSKTQIEGLHAQEEAITKQVALLEEELAGALRLQKKGHMTKTRVLALERAVEELSGKRGQTVTELARVQQAIGEAELQILQIDKDRQEALAGELRESEAAIDDLSERSGEARDSLARTELRAPVGGRVVGLSVHTPGGVVQPGATLMEIVPNEDNLVIEAQVDPMTVDDLVVGMVAEVRFPAFSGRNAPVIEGIVETISADRLHDRESGRYFFATRIQVPDSELEKLQGRRLLPGMPAHVAVQTGERTLLDYLVTPIADVFRQAFREN